MPRKNKRATHLQKARQQRKQDEGPGTVHAELVEHTQQTPRPRSTGNGTITPTPSSTRSFTKLIGLPGSSEPTSGAASDDNNDNHPVPATTTRTIVEISALQQLVSPLLCPQCMNNGLKIEESERPAGLAVNLKVVCGCCQEIVSSSFTSSKSNDSKSFTVNDSAVMSSLLCGFGAYSFNKLCEHMNMPGLHQKTFVRKSNTMFEKTDECRKAVEEKTVKLIRAAHAKSNGIQEVGEEKVLDIAVSYDGSWLTRGHTSKIGIGCAVDVLTGYVIDFHVTSTFCQTCERTGAKVKETKPAAEYEKWLAEHKPHCDINFQGSPAMMETHSAEVLWSRSVEKFRLRYTTMLSDGDAKSFKRIEEVKPYGEEVEVVKEECVNHVGKRMGTALRNLVSDCAKRKITLGGKGKGTLKQETIRKLSLYYTRAIRKSSTVEEMKNAILSTMYHGFSTDTRPIHNLCPPGPGSWCFYNAAVARGEQPQPGSHLKHIRTPLNYDLLSKHLKPVYKRLSEPKLLQRCLLGATQNANECLHSKIWSACPKHKFVTLKKVKFSVLSSVAEFNFGFAGSACFKEKLSVVPGHHSVRLGLSRQVKRLNSATRQHNKAVQHRLHQRRAAKARRQLELQQQEGLSYAAGQF